MNLDERLEALVTNTEVMSGMLKDVLANMDKLTANMEKLTVNMEKLTGTMEKLSAHTDTISQLVIIHESRLKRLEE